MMRIAGQGAGVLAAALLLAAVGVTVAHAGAGGVDGERIRNADAEPGDWLIYGRTYAQQRFSPLDEINVDSVEDLGLAWWVPTHTVRGLEATPLVVDGVMYTTTTWSRVMALNAATGELLWQYDPQVPKAWGAKACCDAVNRGVAIWQGKVYVGTLDGYLVALDADTGEQIWKVNTIDRDEAYTITGAPRVVKGKVIIGNGGGEFGVRGYVSAYDAETGELVWRFYTVPGNPADGFESPIMAKVAKTWTGEWWKMGGGGTVWDSIAYDPELDLLYIGVGNGSPWNWYDRSPGGGDNLFLSSIVALDPDTGEYVWHYQTTPQARWDYTATQHLILATLEIDGEPRKVLMQAPKNGFFYVLDRETGELISAEKYIPATNWAKGIDPETGRPYGVVSYENHPRFTFPSPYGGHNWQPMSYSPDTGLVYIPAIQVPFTYSQQKGWQYHAHTFNIGVDLAQDALPPDMDQLLVESIVKALVQGQLKAWNPVTQELAWKVVHNSPWNGGTLATAGNLVFQGTGDGHLVAWRADNGEQVWRADTRSGIIAAPMTYRVDGVQYVAIMAGWGGALALAGGQAGKWGGTGVPGRILVYKLGGDAQLPPREFSRPVPNPPPVQASEETIARGSQLYHRVCAVCHGAMVISGSNLPDLRYMSPETHEKFLAIVLGGLYRDQGMVSFANVLDLDEAQAIHAYINVRAHQERALRLTPDWWVAVKSWFYDIVAWFMLKLAALTS